MTDRPEIRETTQIPDLTAAAPLEIAREAAKILLNKKASHLKLLSVSDVTVIADYYVIVTGRSSTQIKALSDDLVYEMGRRGIQCARVEGRDGGAWILCDFGAVIVHVFDRESREYYHLERLASPDAEVDCTDLLHPDELN